MYDLMMRFYKPYQILERLPLFRSSSSDNNTSAHVIPVQRAIENDRQGVLPLILVESLISRADIVGIMAECLCRKGENCRHYPREFGCLILGRSLNQLHPGLGREVTKDEALFHGEQGIRYGLFPLVVHNEFDAWMWGINYRGMLNICFCCDCCCSVRKGVRARHPAGFFENIHRLPGLSVKISGHRCTGCGLCVDPCMAGAIMVESGTAGIDLSLCKGCGRCVEICPEKAVAMELPDIDSLESEIYRHYRCRTDVFDG